MAINFPTSPAVNDLYVYNGITYKWDGQFWTAQLNVGHTAHGDSNYTILTTDGFVYTSATFTTPRTWTLPAAAAYGAGRLMTVSDLAGGVTNANTLIVDGNGSETIDGALTYVIMSPYGSVTLMSNGVSWKVVNEVKPQSEDLLASGAFSGVATLDFVLTPYISKKYTAYKIRMARMTSNLANSSLMIRTSTNGGSSYDSGASDYLYQILYGNPPGPPSVECYEGLTTEIYFGWISDTGVACDQEVIVWQPHIAAQCYVTFRGINSDTTGHNVLEGFGMRMAAADVDAVRIAHFSAAFSGYYSLLGMR